MGSKQIIRLTNLVKSRVRHNRHGFNSRLVHMWKVLKIQCFRHFTELENIRFDHFRPFQTVLNWIKWGQKWGQKVGTIGVNTWGHIRTIWIELNTFVIVKNKGHIIYTCPFYFFEFLWFLPAKLFITIKKNKILHIQ